MAVRKPGSVAYFVMVSMITKSFAPGTGVQPFVIVGCVTGVTGEAVNGQREACLALGHVSHGVTITKYATEPDSRTLMRALTGVEAAGVRFVPV